MKKVERYTNQCSSKTNRKKLRKESTSAERKIWKHLRSKQLGGIKFRRQYSVGSFIIDFYSHELKLIIEIDGSIHGEQSVRQQDEKRQRWLEYQGYIVKRYTDEQIYFDIDGVLRDLWNTITNIRCVRTPPNLP